MMKSSRRLLLLPFLFLFAALLPSMLPIPAQAGNMLSDTEFVGQSYRSFELIAPVPDFCRKVCEKDEGCQGWMFSWPGKKGKRAKCFLYRTVQDKRRNTCCIAGYRSRGSSFGKTVANWLKGGERKEGERKEGEKKKERDKTVEPSPPKAAQATGAGSETRQTRHTPRVKETAPSVNAAENAAEQAQSGTLTDGEKRARCREYAQTAMAANREARRLGCGFRGGLWNASYEAYFRSCMNNPLKASEWKTKRRSEQLQECRRLVTTQEEQPATVDRGSMHEHREGPVIIPAERLRPPPPPNPFLPADRLRPPPPPDPFRHAPYVYSWLKSSGPGPRATPWRPTLSGKCPLVRACDCPQGNTCGVYEPGSIAVFWPLGCDGPPVTLVCRVRRR